MSCNWVKNILPDLRGFQKNKMAVSGEGKRLGELFFLITPAYGVYISQLILYARACFAYEDFSKRGRLLTNKSMLQGYFANSTVVIMTLFAITNYHWPMY